MKESKVVLKTSLDYKVCETIEEIATFQNIAALYEASTVFNLSKLTKMLLERIESFFAAFSDSHNFVELSFSSVSKILSSSKLDLTSELEVFNAAKAWLAHNVEERSRFAKNILLPIRLPFLSDHALKFISSEISTLCRENDYVCVLKEFMQTKKMPGLDASRTFYQSRHCDLNSMCLALKGLNNEVKTVNLENFKSSSFPSSREKSRFRDEVVAVKGELFILNGAFNSAAPIEKYSAATRTWRKVATLKSQFSDRQGVCALMDQLFFIGGYAKNKTTASCARLSTKDYKWRKAAALNRPKSSPACSVFNGKIVVCGGKDAAGNVTSSVEAYDHVSDTWSSMPKMVRERCYHKSVAVRNKLFVIGGSTNEERSLTSCEFFDSESKKFVLLNNPRKRLFIPRDKYFSMPSGVVSGGSKVLVFNDSKVVAVYDVLSDKWSKETCNGLKHFTNISCVKVPRFLMNRDSNFDQKVKVLNSLL